VYVLQGSEESLHISRLGSKVLGRFPDATASAVIQTAGFGHLRYSFFCDEISIFHAVDPLRVGRID